MAKEREAPGPVLFGFPRSAEDVGARPLRFAWAPRSGSVRLLAEVDHGRGGLVEAEKRKVQGKFREFRMFLN